MHVDPAVFAAQPSYAAAIVVAEGVPNGPSDAAGDALLREAEEALKARGLERAADDPHVAAWRAAFSAFGAKPSKFNCSAEALAGRVLKGGELPRINRLVDVYNAISVRHMVPVGGEDADRLEGSPRLVIADGRGGLRRPGRPAQAGRGRVARRRRRDLPPLELAPGPATALTEATSRALFIFDRLEPLPLETLEAAVDELIARLTEGWPGATITDRVLLRA